MKSLSSENPATAPVIAATAQSLSDPADALLRARAFAEPLLASAALDTGENILAHADAVAAILKTIGGSQAMQAASYLVYACDHLNKPHEVIAKAFGSNFADLAMETTKLVRVQRMARLAQLAVSHGSAPMPMAQTVARANRERAQDAAGVLARLARGHAAPGVASADLRHFAATKLPVPPGLASEALQVFAPLANRLGIWEIKWEMEDLAFRFLEPDTYREVAACWMKSGWSAKPMWSGCAARWRPIWRAGHRRPPCRGGPNTSTALSKRCAASRWTLRSGVRHSRTAHRGPVGADCYAALRLGARPFHAGARRV
jgi:GTP pyrophosphokinase